MSVFFYFEWHGHEDKDSANVNSATANPSVYSQTDYTFQKDNCAKSVLHRTEKEKIGVYFCEVRANNLKNNFFPRRIKSSPVKFSIKLEKLVLDSFGSQAGDIDQKPQIFWIFIHFSILSNK